MSTGREKDDYQIWLDEYSSDMANITISSDTSATVDYDEWLAQHIGTINIDNDWPPYTSTGMSTNNISLTGGGEEMLRIAEDGFYVRGVKVKQGKREARAVYEAFKQWMTHAILSGELNE
jgi:hypothetical protein